MKIHPPAPRRKLRGFTIIELLVVVTIIAVLAGLVISQAPKMMEEGRKLEVRNVIISMRNGIHSYQVEYNRYPLDPKLATGGDQDAPPFQTDENNNLIETLMGDAANMTGAPVEPNPNSLNPKGIDFVTFKIACASTAACTAPTPPIAEIAAAKTFILIFISISDG